MAAPSEIHEGRVETLETLALLAGFSAPGRLGGGAIPDMVRIDLRRRRILIGDAKHTESPDGVETLSRLCRYFLKLIDWQHAGFDVTLAICHGDELSDALEWMVALTRLSDITGMSIDYIGSYRLTNGDSLVWVRVGSRQLAQLA